MKNKYTKEIIEFYLKKYEGKTCIEMALLINEKFGININKASIQNLRNRLRKKGIKLKDIPNCGQIKKGNIPKNKGKKWDDYLSKEKQERCRMTTFKKGNKPKNAVDIGEEHMRYSGSKLNDPGYLYIKVCNGKGNKNWRPKHVVIYEKYYGPIPENHKVIFADGNRFNFDKDNLILVSDSEELILNRKKLITNNKELTKSGVLIARVLNKTYKVKNGRL